ncbi:AMP-binding protein [Actinoplanes sp. NPDC051411]|uniref:AMP-binding protein n=1 Tax=Actinoplanes sp. NPDC051411 TaxID=3155522 RepID=UPI00342F3F7B
MNAVTRIEELAERNGWRDRVAFRVDAEQYTHSEIHWLGATAAAGLAAHGVRRGDRVLLALPDGAGLVAVFLGAARLGAISVLVNPALTAADHGGFVADCEPAVVVAGDELADRFPPGRRRTFEQLLALADGLEAPEPVEVAEDAPLYVQYTSGTTGRPKGALHTHGQLETYVRCVGRGVLAIGPEDRLLSVSKLYFAYGFGNALVFPLYTGASAVLFDRRPSPKQVAAAVERHGVTLLFSVPSFYAKLLGHLPQGTAGTLRAAVSAGETMPPALGEQVAEALGAPVLEQIGSTEAGHAFCANSVFHNAPGTLGRAVPECDLELRDPAGQPVPPDGIGELWVRSPMIMTGYLNRRAETDAVLADGWLNTRDRVSRRDDGAYVHHGRTDDVEVVGGINVAPAEIEAVLRRHPAVREVAVVAVRTDIGATALRAYVVSGGASGGTALETELIAMARAELAPFKVPRSVRLVGELPRTPSGKVRRFLLRQVGAEA